MFVKTVIVIWKEDSTDLALHSYTIVRLVLTYMLNKNYFFVKCFYLFHSGHKESYKWGSDL